MRKMTFNAAELDKFIILSGKFNFQTELLENVLEDELYGKLYQELQLCAKNQTRKGIIVEDTYGGGCYIGEIADDNTASLMSFYGNSASNVEINIAKDNQLNIEVSNETLMSEDNVKTLFGDQSIIGTGNIDLYRHYLKANRVYFTIYSSNKLNVDTPQDLTTILKASNGAFITGIYHNGTEVLAKSALITYENNVWYTYYDGGTKTPITTLTDIVETI